MADSFLDALVNVAPTATRPQPLRMPAGQPDMRNILGIGPPAAPPPAPPEQGFLSGLGESTLSAGTREFVGLPPTAGAMQFREEHPVGSVLSQIVGFGVPYFATGAVAGTALKALGAANAIRSLPVAARVAAWASDPIVATSRPFVHSAVTEMIKFAPAEAARLGISAAVGGNVGEVAQQIPVNLATIGALSGLYRGGKAVLKKGMLSGGISPGPRGGFQPSNEFEAIIDRHVKDYDVLEAPQLKLRRLMTLEKAIQENPEAYPKELHDAIYDVINGAQREGKELFPGLKNQILTEVPSKEPGSTYKPVRPFEQTSVDYRQVSPWFNVGFSKGRHIRYLKLGTNGFSAADQGLYDAFRARLPEGAESSLLLPRAITFETKEASAAFRRVVNGMMPIGESANKTNAWMVKEQDGFYLIAERVKGHAWPPSKVKNVKGKTLGAGEKDAWMVYKTDRPEHFFPDHAAKNVVLDRVVWGIHREGTEGIAPRIMNFGDRVKTVLFDQNTGKNFSYEDTNLGKYVATLEKSLPGEQSLAGLGPSDRVRLLSKSLISDPETRAMLSGAGHTAEDTAKRLLAPMTALFSKAPFLQRPITAAVAIAARAQKVANDAWLGKQIVPKGVSPIKAVATIKQSYTPDSAKAIFEGLTETDMNQLKWIRGLGHTLDEVLEMKDVSPRVKKFFQKYTTETQPMLYDYNTLHRLEGRAQTLVKPEHFGLVTTEGRQKLPIFMTEDFKDPKTGNVLLRKNQIITIVGGAVPGAASSRAEQLVSILKDLGVKAAYRTQDINREIDIRGLLSEITETDLKSLLHLPGAQDKLRTFFAGSKITKAQYEQSAVDAMKDLSLASGRILHVHRYDYDLAFATRRWPGLTDTARDRINKIFGEQGKFSAKINQEMDKIFGGVLGNQVASRAVMAVNKVMMPLTLGFFDIGYPLMNAIGTLQTMAPELAFIKGAGTQLAKHYDWEFIIRNGEAMPFGNLSPLRLMKMGFKDLFNTTDDALRADVTRSIQEALTDPNFVETFTGQAFGNILDIKKVLSGEQTVAGWAGSILKFLPAKSEQFARMYAFTTGRRAAMMAGLEGEAAYQFAAKFVRRTMYDYATYARPQLLTGPIGTPFGLFKTWSYNYLSNLGTYTGAAMKGNYAPLLWSFATTGAVAGASGMPLFFMADNMAKLAGNKNAMEFLYENSGYAEAGRGLQLFVDAFAYGVPAIFDVTLSSRAEAPSSDPLRDLDMLTSIAALDRFNYLGQAIGDGWAAFRETGTHPGNFRGAREKLIRAVAPRTGYRIWQAVANDGMRSLSTGNQLLPEMVFPKRLMYALGLTPLDVQKTFDVMTELTKDRNKQQKLVATYGDMATDLVEMKDWKGLNHLIKQAVQDGVNPKSLVSSWEARYSKRNEAALDRSFDEYKTLSAKQLRGL